MCYKYSSFYLKLLFVLFSSGIWSCIAAYIYVDSDYMIIKRRICIEISRWGMIARTAVKKEENHYRTFSFTCSTVNELIVLREYNLPNSHCFGIYNDLSPVNTYMIYRTSCCLSLCCVFIHDCNVYSGVIKAIKVYKNQWKNIYLIKDDRYKGLLWMNIIVHILQKIRYVL